LGDEEDERRGMGNGEWELEKEERDGEMKKRRGKGEGEGYLLKKRVDGLRIHLVTRAIDCVCHHYVNVYRSRREYNDIESYVRDCHLALASFVWVS
jgi:hypothetical protein